MDECKTKYGIYIKYIYIQQDVDNTMEYIYIYTHTDTHNGMSFSLKKEELSDTCYKWVNLENIKQS